MYYIEMLVLVGNYEDHLKSKVIPMVSHSYLSSSFLSFFSPHIILITTQTLSILSLPLNLEIHLRNINFPAKNKLSYSNLHPYWSIHQGKLLKVPNSYMKQIKSTKISKTHFMHKPDFSKDPINKIRSSGNFQKITYFYWITIIIALK